MLVSVASLFALTASGPSIRRTIRNRGEMTLVWSGIARVMSARVASTITAT